MPRRPYCGVLPPHSKAASCCRTPKRLPAGFPFSPQWQKKMKLSAPAPPLGGEGGVRGLSGCEFTAPCIKLSIRPLILEETLLKKGFFQAIFPKLLKVLGNRETLWRREPLWREFKGKTLFQKGFPLKLMTLPWPDLRLLIPSSLHSLIPSFPQPSPSPFPCPLAFNFVRVPAPGPQSWDDPQTGPW
jgi:hypothetical protein